MKQATYETLRTCKLRKASYIRSVTLPETTLAAPSHTPSPSNAELEILSVLWREGPRTVRQIHSALDRGRTVGYTTTLKTLQLMTEKGLVTRDESERSHVYKAAAPERAVKNRLVAELLDRAFDGSAAGLVMHALSAKKASPEEREKIRKLLEEHSKGGRR
jgi:BlaI family transcriptional regulator, penicillinase repressor